MRIRSAAIILGVAGPVLGAGDPPVQVLLDMDAATPGIQSSVQVLPCTSVVEGIAVYIVDPLGTRQIFSIGYLGGLDRGIALGHVPAPGNAGAVTALAPQLGAPVNKLGFGWLVQPPGLDPAFVGPEVQYLEFGVMSPATIPAQPLHAIFTTAVLLTNATSGDRYAFHLADFVAVWSGGQGIAGAFCAGAPFPSLDTGGDAVPDGTQFLDGIDLDAPVPVPPAAYLVDYIDGPPQGGPALIEVVALVADVNADGLVDVLDLVDVITRWGQPGGPADVNEDGIVDVLDLVEVLLAWGGGGC
jgi:hypothetical protein